MADKRDAPDEAPKVVAVPRLAFWAVAVMGMAQWGLIAVYKVMRFAARHTDRTGLKNTCCDWVMDECTCISEVG
jgi:hypothetical protein